jgi:hypothetical protein
MTLKRIIPDRLTGMESRTFECERCGQSLTEAAKSDVDPIATAARWVASPGLQPPRSARAVSFVAQLCCRFIFDLAPVDHGDRLRRPCPVLARASTTRRPDRGPRTWCKSARGARYLQTNWPHIAPRPDQNDAVDHALLRGGLPKPGNFDAQLQPRRLSFIRSLPETRVAPAVLSAALSTSTTLADLFALRLFMIRLLQYGHRWDGGRRMRSTMAWRTAGKLG